MLGAILYVKADLGIISSEPMPGAELDLAYLAGLVAVFAAHGVGRLSLDAILRLEQADVVESPAAPARERTMAGSR